MQLRLCFSYIFLGKTKTIYKEHSFLYYKTVALLDKNE